MKCTHVTTYQLFTKLQIEPYFSSLAYEIADSSPDMNIKVTAFTISKKCYYTYMKTLRTCIMKTV